MREQRFCEAEGALDNYHAVEHLWAVARARFGEGEQAAKWVKPLIRQLRHGGETGVARSLRELASIVEAIEPEKRDVDEKAILREWEYFNRHRHHLDCESKVSRGYPVGSGCIESTCKQYQPQVKRCGQFCSTANLEGLMCLHSRHRGRLWN